MPIGGFDPDLPVHAADELAADVQPEPGASDATGELGIEAEELLEDPLPVAWWDSDPLVRDPELNAIAHLAHRDLHAAAVRRVLDAVLDEVAEHLPKLGRV